MARSHQDSSSARWQQLTLPEDLGPGRCEGRSSAGRLNEEGCLSASRQSWEGGIAQRAAAWSSSFLKQQPRATTRWGQVQTQKAGSDVAGHRWQGKAHLTCRNLPLNSVCVFVHTCVYGGSWNNRFVAAVKSFITGRYQTSCKSLGCWCYLLRHEALPHVSVSPTDCYPKMSLKMKISNTTLTLMESDFFCPDHSPFLLVPRKQNPEQSGLHGQFLVVM